MTDSPSGRADGGGTQPAGGGGRRGSGQGRSGGRSGQGGKGQGGKGQGGKRQGGKGQGGKGQGGKGQGGKGQGGKGQAGRSGARDDGIDETVAELSGPLGRVLERLPETQRRVLELRMGLADGHPHDLADTARAMGISLGEAREIEQRAFEHIREAVPLDQLQRFLQR